MSSTLIDKQVRRTVWDGSLPLLIRLASNDNTTIHQPRAFVSMVARNSYLSLLLPQLREFFSPFISSVFQSNDQCWFEIEETQVPLKWQYPVGVLFDLHASAASLPWTLTVHFSAFPSASLLPLNSEESIRLLFVNTMKEANYLKHGDGNKMSQLSLEYSTALWKGLRENDFSLFWSANDQLTFNSLEELKSVPVKILFLESNDQKIPLSMLDFVEPVVDQESEEQRRQTTLLDVLKRCLPDQFGSVNGNDESHQHVNIYQVEEKAGVVGGDEGQAKTSRELFYHAVNDSDASLLLDSSNDDEMKEGNRQPKTDYIVIVQGIVPPLTVSVVWLYEHFSHADNFLYLTVRRK